jgi:tRNA A-37 threonylcarbamoyl transferase component Bud32
MNSIEKIFSQNKQFQNASLVEIFKSKKNTVCLINLNNKNCVLKTYSPDMEKNLIREFSILSKASTPFKKPKLIEKNLHQHYLLMSYVKGENVCDLINDLTTPTQEKIHIIQKLARWFSQFHQSNTEHSNCLIHGDANLRNFLYDDTIIGLDFEEVFIGNPLQDISNLCASILTTEPEFTSEKKRLLDQFLKSYQDITSQELPMIHQEIKKAIRYTQKRRKDRR